MLGGYEAQGAGACGIVVRPAKLIDELMVDIEKRIADNMLPALRGAIAAQLGEPIKDNWSIEVDAKDPQTLNFHYPAALTARDYLGVTYITHRVKLESARAAMAITL